MSPVGVAYIRAKRCHFYFQAVARHQNYAKLRADSDAFGKNLQHLFGCSVGSDVVVLRLTSEQEIAHTAAHQQRLIAMAQQSVTNRIGQLSRGHSAIMRQVWS